MAIDFDPQVVGFSIPNYDAVALNQTALTDTYTFFRGGLAGALQATITITFTDATKATISTVLKT